MKKINSIGYAHKFLITAAVFLIALPICCYLLFILFHVDLFKKIAFVSLGIGIFISLFFTGLLLIEFYQDRAIDRKYATLKKTKMVIGNGMYECQFCGHQQVRATDSECRVCGTCFHQESRKENED